MSKRGNDDREGTGLHFLLADQTPFPVAGLLTGKKDKPSAPRASRPAPTPEQIETLRKQRREKMWKCSDPLCERRTKLVSGAEAIFLQKAKCCPKCTKPLEPDIEHTPDRPHTEEPPLWFCSNETCRYHNHNNPYASDPEWFQRDQGWCAACETFTLIDRTREGFPPWVDPTDITAHANQLMGFPRPPSSSKGLVPDE